ncbi:MAG: hypothetical protein U0930_15540 [Pirellulales bacterium]
MKYLFFILVSAVGCAAWAQDPTTPSKAILDRIKSEPTATNVISEPKAPIKLVLKAIVMQDANRGAALIEAEGRNYRLQLDRSQQDLQHTNEQSPGIQLGGNFYRLQDFTSRSVTLFDGMRSIQVQ